VEQRFHKVVWGAAGMQDNTVSSNPFPWTHTFQCWKKYDKK
jgi:hypothetical protein